MMYSSKDDHHFSKKDLDILTIHRVISKICITKFGRYLIGTIKPHIILSDVPTHGLLRVSVGHYLPFYRVEYTMSFRLQQYCHFKMIHVANERRLSEWLSYDRKY